MGIEFEVMTKDVDEHTDLRPMDAVALLARRKAQAVAEELMDGWVLGADTLVSMDDRALGKPESEDDARRMLRSLSGRTHEVYTGICLIDVLHGKVKTHVEATRVTFRPLTDGEIDAYIATGEPMDKAGAYGIQGGAGAFVTGIEGSYHNVMGLPTEAIEQMISDWEA